MLLLIDHPFNEGSSLPMSPHVSPNGIILTQGFHVSVIWNITHDPTHFLFYFLRGNIPVMGTRYHRKGAMRLNLLGQLNRTWNHQGNTAACVCVREGVCVQRDLAEEGRPSVSSGIPLARVTNRIKQEGALRACSNRKLREGWGTAQSAEERWGTAQSAEGLPGMHKCGQSPGPQHNEPKLQ